MVTPVNPEVTVNEASVDVAFLPGLRETREDTRELDHLLSLGGHGHLRCVALKLLNGKEGKIDRVPLHYIRRVHAPAFGEAFKVTMLSPEVLTIRTDDVAVRSCLALAQLLPDDHWFLPTLNAVLEVLGYGAHARALALRCDEDAALLTSVLDSTDADAMAMSVEAKLELARVLLLAP